LVSKSGSASNKDYAYKLDRAQYFMRSNPVLAENTLAGIYDLNLLTDEQKISYYVLKMRLSLTLNKLSTVEPIVDALFKFDNQPEFREQLVSVLSGVGIWLRKINDFDSARHTFSCALKHASKDSQRISLLISSAIVARYQHDYKLANSIYKEARDVALRMSDQRALATIDNNLGTIAMDQKNISLASEYFRSALAGFQLANNHSGHINSGINLLLTFVIQEQYVNYQRLYPRIFELSEEYSDASKKAYLIWVNAGYYHAQGAKIDPITRKNLINAFDELAGPQLKLLIKEYLADPIGVDVKNIDPTPAIDFAKNEWYEKVLSCNW
jgi:tetratricopeptide (TPR) repeat protein